MTQQNGNRNEVACQRKLYHPVVTLADPDNNVYWQQRQEQ